MKVTAILNLKGGVGKTVTTVNMAAILADQHKKRVLVIDGDSQCNTTEFFGGDPKKGNLAKLLRSGNVPDTAWGIQSTRVHGVDLLAADDSLMDLDLTKVETQAAKASVLKELRESFDSAKLYDWIIIDCPPAFNAASCAALIAADEVIIPIKLDAFSLRGMGNLMAQVRNIRGINPALTVAGILPTMWYKSGNIIDAEKQLRASGLPVFSHIRRTGKVDDMTFAQDPLIVSSPHSAACIDYKRFVAELVGRCE